MIKQQSKEWHKYLSKALLALSKGKPLAFSKIVPSLLPKEGGVYLISARLNGKEIAYYVGRSKNLRQRIYQNHLMGRLTNARLKKYLVHFGECKNPQAAKIFIKSKCHVRWFLEKESRNRGAVEGYVTAKMFPKYGIYEEH